MTNGNNHEKTATGEKQKHINKYHIQTDFERFGHISNVDPISDHSIL
jgi:hypothetical protein